MSTTAEKMCIEVLSLPKRSRLEIAERILTSLEDETDPTTEREWKALFRRRQTEMRSGKAKLRPADEVMRRAFDAIS
jgi:putative addiction module component (TIGR02574 family)